ncbi:MAG: ribosomal protein L16 [Candidatus Parvarchaeum acidophilus ARMAN-5]|jgi:large subunit ribosomal protein L10e|uniref:Ribosomal protein L16 n=1 Tax=Candidatus Parvarchaeum acidophilus ARMAN-5 TaxID=662762 RepID=D6GVR1_PARA5|nr:MAG: ribosomal protein L16 [Candidatus Parvarchaeum acidophilus ARMAN-5]
MVKLRPGRAYRGYKLPYTRKSKYKTKNYIKIAQRPKLTQYHSGNTKKEFDSKVFLVSEKTLILRDNALEAARIVANKFLTDSITDQNFHIVVVSYPHHVLREHKLATGAGADRFSSGMQKSFGKPIGLAARLNAGTRIFEIHVDKNNLKAAKTAAFKMSKKLGIQTRVVVA